MRAFSRWVGTAVIGGGLLMGMPEHTQAQIGGAAILEIVAINASKNSGAVDPRLRPMMADLNSLPYQSFSLLGVRACTVKRGDRCGMRVANDAYLAIRAVENAPNFLRLNVVLNRKNRPVFDANLKINRNAGVVLTNIRREGPALVMSIKVRDEPQPIGSEGRR